MDYPTLGQLKTLARSPDKDAAAIEILAENIQDAMVDGGAVDPDTLRTDLLATAIQALGEGGLPKNG